MSPQSARTMVLVSAGVMFVAIALRRDQIKDVYRYAWAAGVITLFLSVLADLTPEIAGPFAMLILLAVWFRNRGTFSASTALPKGSEAVGHTQREGTQG